MSEKIEATKSIGEFLNANEFKQLNGLINSSDFYLNIDLKKTISLIRESIRIKESMIKDYQDKIGTLKYFENKIEKEV